MSKIDVIAFDTVSAMAADTTIPNGKLVQTRGYSTAGVGANLYRYDATSTATADGGFVINATGAGGGRFIAVDQTVADVTKFGAIGNGVADDTAAVQAAIDSGKPVYVPSGSYLIGSALTRPGALHMFGTGTLLSDVDGTLLSVTGELELSGVTFDGQDNGVTEYLVAQTGLGDRAAKIIGCTFKNQYSTTFAYALTLTGPKKAIIENCTFSRIRALANSTIGDQNGSVRAIYLTYDTEAAISKCAFDDINSVNVGGVNVFEDADAIHVFSPGSETNVVTITQCRFTNCGKRAAKFQGGSAACRYAVTSCTIESAWDGTADGYGNTNQGMYAVFESFAGVTTISQCTATGGPVGHFASAATNAVALHVLQCEASVEYHDTIVTASTAAIISTASACAVTVADSDFASFRYGIYTTAQKSVSASRCQFTVDLRGALINSGSGQHRLRDTTFRVRQQSFAASTDDTCTSAGHNLANTDRVYVYSTGTLPSGLSSGTAYYVIDATTTTFKLSLTSGGAAVNITSTGTGTHTFVKSQGYGVYVGDGLGQCVVSGNHITGFQDALYLLAQTGSTFLFSADANTFIDNSRNILSNFGSEVYPNVNVRNNYPDTTRVTAP